MRLTALTNLARNVGLRAASTTAASFATDRKFDDVDYGSKECEAEVIRSALLNSDSFFAVSMIMSIRR
jgi:hypothetical protein